MGLVFRGMFTLLQSASEENMVCNYCPHFKEYINNFLCLWIHQRTFFYNDLKPLGWIHTKHSKCQPFSKKGAAQLSLEFGSKLNGSHYVQRQSPFGELCNYLNDNFYPRH